MAIGQVQTGTRPGGGISTGTPYRTTPLPPGPIQPINSGRTRQPPGMNTMMGRVRSDRGTAPMSYAPGRTRVLRPLIADRLQPMQRPMQTQPPMFNPAQQVMPQTMQEYMPAGPQMKGPFAPTPGTAGPSFSQWAAAHPGRWAAVQNGPRFDQFARAHPDWIQRPSYPGGFPGGPPGNGGFVPPWMRGPGGGPPVGAPVNPPTMGINPRVDPATGQTVYW